MLYYRQVPKFSQTNLNEIYASQTASIERGGHPDMDFLHTASLFGSGSYPLIRLFEFIQGDLCLGTHSARTRAKKKPAHTASLPSESARAAASDGLKSNGHPHGRLLASSSTASLINLPVGRPWRKSKAAKTADQQGRVPEQGLIEAIH